MAKARALLVRDIKDMQNAPVTDLELTRAKAQMLRRLPMQRDSLDSLAELLLRLEDLGLPLDTPQTAAKIIYGATAAQIQDSFKTNLRPDDLAQVVKGPVGGK